jgi:hypothetical protein
MIFQNRMMMVRKTHPTLTLIKGLGEGVGNRGAIRKRADPWVRPWGTSQNCHLSRPFWPLVPLPDRLFPNLLRQNENGTRKTVFGKRPKLSLFRIVGGIMTKTSETLASYPQIAAAPQRHGSVTKCGCWQFNGTGS